MPAKAPKTAPKTAKEPVTRAKKTAPPTLKPPKHTQPGYQDPPLPKAPGLAEPTPTADTAAAKGLQLQLPASQIVMVVGIREDGVSYFDVLGPRADLVTTAGLVDLARRNVDGLYAAQTPVQG